MHKTNALPSSEELFGIDELLCLAQAARVAAYRPSSVNKLSGGIPDSVQLAFKIAFIAICHKMNWDFLQERLRANFPMGSSSQDLATFLRGVTSRVFEKWMEDYEKPERIRSEERAKYLRSIGETLVAHYNGDAGKMLVLSDRRLRGPSGFLAQLQLFDPFRMDPLRKKSNVLVHDLVREGIVRFDDESEIAPAIDYHLIRLYLRTGRVYPLHSQVFQALITADPRPRARMVQLLREKVSEALTLTARHSRLSIPDLNYVEWQIGRTMCIQGEPLCVTSAIPPRLDLDVLSLFSGGKCPFADTCTSFSNPSWMSLQEPVFNKSFY